MLLTISIGFVVQLSLPKKAFADTPFAIGLIFRGYNAGLWRVACFDVSGGKLAPKPFIIPAINILSEKSGVQYNREELAKLSAVAKLLE